MGRLFSTSRRARTSSSGRSRRSARTRPGRRRNTRGAAGECVRDALAAGALAAAVSGLPSTLHALATGRDPLEATLAAGSLLLPHEERRPRLVLAAAPVHLAVSLAWAVLLERTLLREPRIGAGAAAGLVIAALDLGLVGRRFARIRALPVLPQVADHVAYGAVAAAALRRRRSR